MYVRREMIPFTPICGEFPSPPMQTSKFFGKRSRSNSFRAANFCKKYVGRQLTLAWKRVTMSTRKPERTSMLIEGFDILNSKRRTIYFGKPGVMPTSIPVWNSN